MNRVISTVMFAVLVLASLSTAAMAQNSEDEVREQLQRRLEERLERVRQETLQDIERTVREFRQRQGQQTPAQTQTSPAQRPTTSAPAQTTPAEPAAPRERPSLGFSVADEVPAAVSRSLSLQPGQGALVSSVREGSLAQKSGLAVGDVVLSINGTPVGSRADIGRVIGGVELDTFLSFVVVRGGERVNLRVPFGNPSDAGNVANPNERTLPPEARQQLESMGLDPELAEELMNNPQGLQDLIDSGQIPPEVGDLLGGGGQDPQAMRENLNNLLGGQDPNQLLEQFFPGGAPQGVQDLIQNLLGGGAQQTDPNAAPADPNAAPADPNAAPAAPGDLNQFFNQMFGNQGQNQQNNTAGGNTAAGNATTGNSTEAQPAGPRAWLGFSGRTSENGGVLITGVTENGPCAGILREGDVVTRIGQTNINENADVRTALAASEAGSRVTITYTRDGRVRRSTVVVGQR
ncbi:MAG: PDZ domain-containing protein [Planctomycetes bacterium]|nr:PDZ domain-containing protein [Planctomycetota bacterium]